MKSDLFLLIWIIAVVSLGLNILVCIATKKKQKELMKRKESIRNERYFSNDKYKR